MAFLTEFDALDERAGNALLYNWIKYRREELFEELRVSRPALEFWSLHPGNPDVPSESGPDFATLLTRREDVKHALASYSMKPYVLSHRFLLSEDEPDMHALLREALSESFQVPDYPDMLDEAIDHAWRKHVQQCDGTERQVTLDVRRFGRDVALVFARRFFGLPASHSSPDQLEEWSELGYERFIWKLHARHFVETAPDPSNEALARIGQLVGTRWQNPVPGSMIERLRSRVDNGRGLTDERLIGNVVGSLQGLVDNVMTGACYALNELARSGTLDTVQFLAREGRWQAIRSLLHAAHRADTPSPFLPRRLPPSAADAKRQSVAVSPSSEHMVCAIGSALADPAANRETAADAWDLRLGYGPHACLGKRMGDDLMVRIIAAVAGLDDVEVAEPLRKQWGWIVSAFTVSGTRSSCEKGVKSPQTTDRGC